MSLLPNPIVSALCILPYLFRPNCHFYLSLSYCIIFSVVFHDSLDNGEKCSAEGVQLSDHRGLQTHPGVRSTLPEEGQ
jgi:hypothetical protein